MGGERRAKVQQRRAGEGAMKVGGFRDAATKITWSGIDGAVGTRLVESRKRPSPPSVYVEQSTPVDAKL